MKLKEEKDNVFWSEDELNVEPHETERKKQRKFIRWKGETWELMMGKTFKGEVLPFGQSLKSSSSAGAIQNDKEV